MFPPNATDLDIYDYHDGEARYHLKASEVLIKDSSNLIELAKENRLSNRWEGFTDRAALRTQLARHHNTMSRFHIKMMIQTRENMAKSV